MMKVFLRLTKALAKLNNGQKEAMILLDGDCTMAGLIEHLNQTMPGFKETVLTMAGAICDSINIYVNGENIRSLAGIGTLLSDGDHVGIIPAAAAG